MLTKLLVSLSRSVSASLYTFLWLHTHTQNEYRHCVVRFLCTAAQRPCVWSIGPSETLFTAAVTYQHQHTHQAVSKDERWPCRNKVKMHVFTEHKLLVKTHKSHIRKWANQRHAANSGRISCPSPHTLPALIIRGSIAPATGSSEAVRRRHAATAS